jgi:hypothetical protein
MTLDPLTAALDLGKDLINKIWPDPSQRAEQLFKLKELEQKGDLAELNAHVGLMLAQIKVNEQDAKSSNPFQAMWRPAVGWVGALSLFMMYIPKAIVQTYIWSYQSLVVLDKWDGVSQLHIPAFPDLGAADVIGLMISLLGVGVMRSYEKTKGIDTK